MGRFIPTDLAIMRLQGYDRMTIPRWTIVAAIVSFLVAITLWRISILLWRWWQRPIVSPKRLFRALCDQHRLSHAERHLLQQIASEGSFDPNFLFIDAGLWRFPPHPPEASTQRQALFCKVFGETKPA